MSTLNTVTISIEEYKLLITKAEAFKTKRNVWIRESCNHSWNKVEMISDNDVINNLNAHIKELSNESANLRDLLNKELAKKKSWL